MLPEGWKPYRLGELMSFRNGLNFKQADNGEAIKIVGVADFKARSILADTSELATISVSGSVRKADLLQDGDLLFVRSNGNRALIGRCLYFPSVQERLSFSGFTIRGRIDSTKVLPEFSSYLVRADHVTAQFFQEGSGTNISNLSQEILSNIFVTIPNPHEQARISKLLLTWDKAISATEKLLANSRRQKQIVSQGLLSGARRLRKTEPWEKRTLSELIVESRLPGSTGAVARKITVKLYGKGVISKEERRAGSESTRYYRRVAGQFIYSKLDFLNGAFGLIPPELDGYESTLDLPAFDFHPGVDRRWFLYYVSREDFYQGHLGLANGGRKARRVNPLDLLRVAIRVPSLAEQKAIADVIDAAIADENAWLAMLEALKAEKRALMQQLLTGKRRVRLPSTQETMA